MVARTLLFVDATDLTRGIVDESSLANFLDEHPTGGPQIMGFDTFMEQVLSQELLSSREAEWLERRCARLELRGIHHTNIGE